MAGEERILRKFMASYRNVLLFLGCILLAQLILAIKLIFIVENDGLTSNLPLQDSTRSEDTNGGIRTRKDTKSHIKIQTPAEDTNSQLPAQIHLNVNSACEITGKEAVSAIRRAKTQYCKEYLANVTCRLNSDELYPLRLPRFCHKHGGTTYMKHVGCFQDDKEKRVLQDHSVILKESNSPQNCVDVCLRYGFAFAGVQYSVECFCSHNAPAQSPVSDASLCNMKCPSISSNIDNTAEKDVELTCGGYFLIDVYETGVFRGERSQPASDLSSASTSFDGPMSEMERARIVFFLTLNGRALRQVIRLIKSLFHQRHYFYIHVDARQDYLFRELLRLGHKLPNNVQLMRERQSTIWGGASLLKILLTGMEDVVKNGENWNWHWDYFINLSESDFPLKTVTQLETFLTINKGKNFLKSHERDAQSFILKQGLDKTFVECEFRMWRIGERKLPAGIVIDGGSDWIGLHYDFVQYIVRKENELIRGLLRVFEYALLPAESFFHTLLRNSEQCNTFVDNNLHITNWKRKLGCKCQYKNIVDWCGCSPNDFRLSDWNRLEGTKSKLLFFGRKFEAVVNQAVVNQLESSLYPDRALTNFPTFDRYWQSIYHRNDLTPKPDDSVITLGSSLGRIATKELLKRFHETITIEISTQFKEISVYMENDRVEGILVHSELFDGDKLLINIESWHRLESFAYFEPWGLNIDKYHARIQHLQVGSNYDQKEQIFRNFGGSIGPMSEPTLAYHVYAESSLNFTFVWLNPLNSIQAVQNFTVDAGTTANFARPSLKMPLIPGNWTVKVLSGEGNLIAHAIFLVSFAEFSSGKPISYQQHKLLNHVFHRDRKFTMEDDTDWNYAQLHYKIDLDTKGFYQLVDTCVFDRVSQNNFEDLTSNRYDKLFDVDNSLLKEWKYCESAEWSTAFPDPKSTVSGIDPISGLLLP